MNNPRRKRRRYFSSNLMAKKKKDLYAKTGIKGFICTCNGNEGQCIRESYNILNEYADKLYGEEKVTNSEQQDPSNSELQTEKLAAMDEDDVLDEFKKEVDALQSENAQKTRRFQARDTGIMNCIFIETNSTDPVKLADVIMKDLFETKQRKARFLLRMVPIAVTCPAYMNELEKTAGPLFDEHFKSDPTTYAVVFTKRCNSTLERDAVIEKLAAMVQERNREHKVNLSHPATAIVVEVMKSICGLSVIRDYHQLSKYNLSNLCANETTAEKESMGTAATVAENVVVEEENPE